MECKSEKSESYMTEEEPPEGFGEPELFARDPHLEKLAAYNAAVEQMLAYEQAGGDGWWKGWKMLKAVYNAER